MRATTRWTPNVSRATRAEMMLELSPEETAANASARSMPASMRTSWSNPIPVTVWPENSPPRRRNASGLTSITDTECPRCSRLCARVEPTRPHPMMTTCTGVGLRTRTCAYRMPLSMACPGANGGLDPAGEHGRPPVRLTVVASPTSVLKRLLVGRPFRSDRLQHTLLPKRIALPVFASDALSSVAYAPDEILLTLSVAGATWLAFSPWIAIAVAVVMLTVLASYRQHVHAYPSGGGDYEVASVNLGPRFGLAVASALLVDYVLTVAVSTASGVANLGSVVPWVAEHKVVISVIAIFVLASMNLRGIRESGAAFAIPTYGFMI